MLRMAERLPVNQLRESQCLEEADLRRTCHRDMKTCVRRLEGIRGLAAGRLVEFAEVLGQGAYRFHLYVYRRAHHLVDL